MIPPLKYEVEDKNEDMGSRVLNLLVFIRFLPYKIFRIPSRAFFNWCGSFYLQRFPLFI